MIHHSIVLESECSSIDASANGGHHFLLICFLSSTKEQNSLLLVALVLYLCSVGHPYFVHLDKKADCTLTLSDADLLALMTGKLNPQTVSASSSMSCSGGYYTLITLRNRSNTAFVSLNSV